MSSFRSLNLSKLYVAVKFIGEKDPIASVEQRVTMLNLQLADSSLPIEVIVQNVKGHIDNVFEFVGNISGWKVSYAGVRGKVEL